MMSRLRQELIYAVTSGSVRILNGNLVNIHFSDAYQACQAEALVTLVSLIAEGIVLARWEGQQALFELSAAGSTELEKRAWTDEYLYIRIPNCGRCGTQMNLSERRDFIPQSGTHTGNFVFRCPKCKLSLHVDPTATGGFRCGFLTEAEIASIYQQRNAN